MSTKRLQTGRLLRDANSPETREASMIASGTEEPRFLDRRLRNRLVLLNLLAWAAIAGLLFWFVL